ncbi:LytR C-terminal domain-containing protein [Microbacterium sp. NPDC055910]|uniref:LytR C-terminal domain-containing protein n=1 Tax=Microbacterium sp. NPDC055910 TaxID=3345659 RepID=UPI0035DE649D
MPKSTFPRDRFDDIPAEVGRVGAHRAENPRMRGWVVLLWAVLATIVLIVIGIFGTLLASGRIELFPTPEPTPEPTVQIEPVIDTTYAVNVLNATPEEGLATQLKDVVVAAGWPADSVLASGAGSDDFTMTTVFYLDADDEAAALGLADVIGGAEIEQSEAYQLGDPDTKQLTIVIGLDRTSTPPEPAPTE